jgi:guanosine-3',5'-bis(diphosphate) 3'-pyrophosphohydrolase
MERELQDRALQFALKAHTGQFRKDGVTSFIRHPIAVAAGLMGAGVTCQVTLAAALLHDVLEDTPTTYEELREAFGAEVADLVVELTDDKTLSQAERKRLEILHAKTASERAKQIKIADKRENLYDIMERPASGWDATRCRHYCEFACAIVEAASGAHKGLEKLFFETYGRAIEVVIRRRIDELET